MATTAQRPKLLAIVGPTASGKSALAIDIAKEFNGEIIAADSRTVYKGMNIGAAKPSSEEQKEITHWGLDLVQPGQKFSAYHFKTYAEDKIKDIQKRGKLPVLVGGTGLYLDSVLFDFGFVEPANTEEREDLEKLSVAELQEVIRRYGYEIPENSKNRRYLISAIQRKGNSGTSKKIRQNTLIIGLMPPDKELKERIAKRAEAYFKKGLEQEAAQLMGKYGEKALETCGGIAYQASIELINGRISQVEATELIKKQEWQYARRQRTWFKRNKFITWFDSPRQAYLEVSSILNN
jgi:tRNA dimethylallyltransferase